MTRRLVQLALTLTIAGCHRDATSPAAVAVAPPAEPGDRARALAEFERGQALFASGDVAGARAAFSSATEADAAFAPAWTQLGRTLVTSSQGMSFSRAVDCLERALALDPTQLEAHAGLGVAHFGLVDYETAQRDFDNYLETGGDAAPAERRGDAHHHLGVLARLRGDFALALLHLTSAAELRPRFADTRYESGITEEAAGRPELAVSAFEAALELERNHLPSHFRLARLYRQLGREADAARAEKIHRALNALFDNSTGRDQRDPRRRAEQWGEIALLDPRNRTARFEHARALLELDRAAEAQLAVDGLIRDHADYFDAHVFGIDLALRRRDRGDAAARVRALRAALPAIGAEALPAAMRPLWETS
ncbi:MAG: tetratricopeptide repeat protein [Myxococcales bacterium]|nr:tetratricopeptide repeat protein [Myxococcales bacterium]